MVVNVVRSGGIHHFCIVFIVIFVLMKKIVFFHGIGLLLFINQINHFEFILLSKIIVIIIVAYFVNFDYYGQYL